MKTTLFTFLAAFAQHSLASAIPTVSELVSRQSSSCENTATSRDCWGDYSIDTDWYSVTPDTGVTREYWLSVQNVTVSPDGVERYALTFNGTIPGPAIIADWGDNLIIHVTNDMAINGTAIHWHGIRQLGTVEYDGVPGVTQCPITPGTTMTYKFQATQYGSTWYHSHFTLQYGDGLLGPMIINGPATANYDVDLGALFLSDWSHRSVFELWDSARLGGPPALENGLINGTNTYNGLGKKFETTFESGTKYRIRLVNTAVDGHFQFSIDGHSLQVIATDLVPIVPYTTDSVLVSIGQRYDVIVEANATVGDYWIRAGWVTACSTNDNAANITGIVRYDSSSTADPTSVSNVTASSNCGDEPVASLVPYLSLDVDNLDKSLALVDESLDFQTSPYFQWTINSSTLLLNWTAPTIQKIFKNETIWPTDYNVVPIDVTSSNDNWTVLVIEDNTGIGITHPIHLHGHDFWILSQDTTQFDASTTTLNTANPPRRDVASLPGNGHLAIAFKKDNPGSWLVHCHIAWHASEGLALQFVESESQIAINAADTTVADDVCDLWANYYPTEEYPEDDSGI